MSETVCVCCRKEVATMEDIRVRYGVVHKYKVCNACIGLENVDFFKVMRKAVVE